jgi:hypothetical protein
MKENEWRIDHLIFGFSIGAIASYMLLSSSFVSSESVYMLIIFNFLFHDTFHLSQFEIEYTFTTYF